MKLMYIGEEKAIVIFAGIRRHFQGMIAADQAGPMITVCNVHIFMEDFLSGSLLTASCTTQPGRVMKSC